ncbi:MAG: hypothetical protein P4L40_04225, partial [Terracidiphilus sp.]|nr:hypothetical protein [Terracidiphilus sp.]
MPLSYLCVCVCVCACAGQVELPLSAPERAEASEALEGAERGGVGEGKGEETQGPAKRKREGDAILQSPAVGCTVAFSGVPASQWKNLPYMDIIQQRNKPTQPPKVCVCVCVCVCVVRVRACVRACVCVCAFGEHYIGHAYVWFLTPRVRGVCVCVCVCVCAFVCVAVVLFDESCVSVNLCQEPEKAPFFLPTLPGLTPAFLPPSLAPAPSSSPAPAADEPWASVWDGPESETDAPAPPVTTAPTSKLLTSSFVTSPRCALAQVSRCS